MKYPHDPLDDDDDHRVNERELRMHGWIEVLLAFGAVIVVFVFVLYGCSKVFGI